MEYCSVYYTVSILYVAVNATMQNHHFLGIQNYFHIFILPSICFTYIFIFFISCQNCSYSYITIKIEVLEAAHLSAVIVFFLFLSLLNSDPGKPLLRPVHNKSDIFKTKRGFNFQCSGAFKPSLHSGKQLLYFVSLFPVLLLLSYISS